jgi:hypothetical protein
MRWRRWIASLGPAAVLAAAVGAATAACGAAAERAVIDRFFQAARLHDLTALRSFATADFPPHTNGIVIRYDVLDVSDERRVATPAAKYAESEVVRLSFQGAAVTPDGFVEEKVVLIEATVQPREGVNETQHLAVTLQRAVGESGAGRWIVTRVERRAR